MLTSGPRIHARAYRHSEAVTIRWATPADDASLETLSALDEASVPAAPLLLGLVDDQLRVAVSLSSRELIADPFEPTAELAALVFERGRQLTVRRPRRMRTGTLFGRRHRDAPSPSSRGRVGLNRS